EQTIVSQEAVIFVFHIGDLRVDGSVQLSVGLIIYEVIGKIVIDRSDVIGGIGPDIVAAGESGIPQMSGQLKADPAVFSIHGGLGAARWIARGRVTMVV